MVMSKRISQFYLKPSVFKDKDVLKKGHHPHSLDDVIHRDDVINNYLTSLHEAIDNKVPDNLLIYGSFGTGKTMLTQLITSEIALAAESIGNKVIVIYIYCETMSTTSPLMQYMNQSLINNLNGVKKFVGISKAKNFEYFYDLVNEADVPVIIILDEIDKLKEPDIINQMSRMKECGFTKNNVCIIGITNDTNFYENLDSRTKSVLGQNELYIPPYDAEELRDILSSRAETAFVDGACDSIVIPLCAAFGAQEKGDARTAIDLLRTSGDIADRRESPIIEEEDVRAAREGLEINKQLEVAGSLPTQAKCVLFACTHKYNQTGKAIDTNEIYSIYSKICGIISLDPVKIRRVNDYIGELNTLGIISVNKISRGRRKGVYNAISPMTDNDAIKQLILEDFSFSALKNKLDERGFRL